MSFPAGGFAPPTVFSRIAVIRHHRVRLRFVEGHPSDDHSVGAGPRHLGSCLVDGGFWHHQRRVLDDLDRAVFVFLGGRWIIASEILVLFLLRRTHKVDDTKRDKFSSCAPRDDPQQAKEFRISLVLPRGPDTPPPCPPHRDCCPTLGAWGRQRSGGEEEEEEWRWVGAQSRAPGWSGSPGASPRPPGQSETPPSGRHGHKDAFKETDLRFNEQQEGEGEAGRAGQKVKNK